MEPVAAVQEDHKTEVLDNIQRFFRILGKGLKIRLETTLRKDSLASYYDQILIGDQLVDKLALGVIGLNLPKGFSIRDPNANGNKSDAQTVSLLHPAESNGVELDAGVLMPIADNEPMLILNFGKIPDGLPILFQRINLKQNVYDGLVVGLTCGRSGEIKPFPVQDRNGKPYANLDCFSRTKEWNPLFAKYHLAVAPTLKASEYGYLKIDVRKTETGEVEVATVRVSETEVPEFLKTAQTFPR